MQKRGFDTARYLRYQKNKVISRIKRFDKLYLEIGGKLCYDFHASRVLPGYAPTTKISFIKCLKDAEIIHCVNAKDIQSGRVVQDFNLTYDQQTLKDIKDLNDFGLKVSAVIITRYSNETKASKFQHLLLSKGVPAHFSYEIKGYPKDIRKVLRGYEKQPYIQTKKNLIIVTGAASGSGKMGFALSQIYHEIKNGKNSGFAKFETFPIHDLPLNHPINLAYEAATADLGDCNVIDPYHLKAYKKKSVNYNRDVENFYILMGLVSAITSRKDCFGYLSPTDMGINMAKKGIVSDSICRQASLEEIKRRYAMYSEQVKQGVEKVKTLRRMKQIIKVAGIKNYNFRQFPK